MQPNTNEIKKIGLLGLLVIIGFLLISFRVIPLHSQTITSEEQMVREILMRFKDGIEKGDFEVATQITTKDFYPFFKGFYESLANGYSQHKISFPMEIGHLKILRSGLAKVEVYINPAKNLFIFTMKKEEGMWKISHNESIRFPLYSIPELPYEEVYKIPAGQRRFMTAEMELNFMTRVYFNLKENQGQEDAINFFLDGPGYKVAMDAWLPFLEGAAQFAFYYVILESNFFGSECEVIQADYDEAEVYCHRLAALEVLKRGHAVPKFSYDEYTQLLTALMEHRAQHCGLELELSFNDTSCRLNIREKAR